MGILHKRNNVAGVAPATSELTAGEIAINTADGRIYTRKSDGTVVALNPVYAALAHSHAIADTTGLQTTLDGKAATSHTHVVSDVSDLVGAFRLSPLSAAHRIYGAANATSFGASALTANRLMMSPMVAPASFTAASIKLAATSAVASSAFALGIYASGANGWPTGAPLANSGSLSGAAIAELSAAISVSIVRGNQYWLGVMSGSPAATVRRHSVGAVYSLGQTAAGTGQLVSILRTITFGTWPDFTTTPVDVSELATNLPAAVMITT
jgi:hypothetical protein